MTTNPEAWGDRAKWAEWTEDVQDKITYERPVAYDPRREPWFLGAISLYNSAIESLIYESPVRRAFGLRAAGLAYVLVGYGTNTLYTRLRPTTRAKTAVLATIVSAMRLWRRAWLAAARAAARRGAVAGAPG